MLNNFFINEEIPDPFTHEEQMEYFKRYKNGDLNARNLLITHNIKLVLSIVMPKYENSGFEAEDLVSVGVIGLIKAVDTFDIDKLFYFSTYAARCVNNEILMFLRNKKKETLSLCETIGVYSDGREITLMDVIPDKKTNLELSYILNEFRLVVPTYIDKIDSSRDREIIKAVYGFGCDRMTQREAAKQFNLSQAQISRITNRRTKEIIYKLYKDGFLDLNSNEQKKLVLY